MLTDLRMDGSGSSGLSYTYIHSAQREHIDRAMYQVNTMKYVVATELQTKTTIFTIIFIFVASVWSMTVNNSANR